MKIIKLELNCGEKTCASSPGNFCRFARSSVDGFLPRCTLFGERLFDETGTSVMGWLQRLPKCLQAEEEE